MCWDGTFTVTVTGSVTIQYNTIIHLCLIFDNKRLLTMCPFKSIYLRSQ